MSCTCLINELFIINSLTYLNIFLVRYCPSYDVRHDCLQGYLCVLNTLKNTIQDFSLLIIAKEIVM